MKLLMIIENVEKLLPHLEKEIDRLLELRQTAGLPATIPSNQNKSNWLKKASEWVLRSDPRYLKDKAQGKSLQHSKSPFAKHIVRWWLDPQADGGIQLPEDIATTAETLKKFSNAAQRGLNTDVATIANWGQLNNILAPYLTAEDAAPSDKYNRMGFDLVFQDGPWKVYKIDQWVPGELSDVYKDLPQHKAFEGTQWCVKYERTFLHSYKPPYFLVLQNERKFALIHLPSMQFKSPNDVPIYSTDKAKGIDFLQRFFAVNKPLLDEIFVKSLGASQYARNDFDGFMPYLDITVPNTEELRQAAERQGSRAVEKIAKYTKAWPHFEDWPTGRELILKDVKNIYAGSPLYQLTAEAGRIPKVEQNIIAASDTRAAVQYAQAVLKAVGQYDVDDMNALGKLVNIVTINAIKLGSSVATTIKSTASAKQLLLQAGATRLDSPDLKRVVLNSQDPTGVYAYAVSTGERWPEAEAILALNHSLAAKYCAKFNIPLDEVLRADDAVSPAMFEVRKSIASGNESDKEDLILTDLAAALLYAQHVVGPWAELEQKLQEEGTAEQQKIYQSQVLRL